MATLAGLPYVALKFNKDGTLVAPGPVSPGGVTDLIVISHGWHQQSNDSQDMYDQILTQLQAVAPMPAGRTLGVTGIFWPSDLLNANLSPDNAATVDASGQAAAMGSGADLADLIKLARQKAQLFGMTPDKLEELATAAATGGDGDRDDLVKEIRKKLADLSADAETQAEHPQLLDPAIAGRDIVTAFPPAAGGGGARAGGAAASLDIFGGLAAAVANVINQGAYFALKARAGTVGGALGGLLQADGLAGVQRLHLIGHSFGARLVTAATSAMTTLKPYSLTMLQGAFSHNALGVNIQPGVNGAFRNVVSGAKVSQRIVITHTWNDMAVGVAYAIASRASNDIAAGLIHVTPTFGGAQDIHGGMGANGALRLQPGEGTEAEYDGAAVLALGGGIHNLHCDFIKSHTDIRTPQAARVIAAAIA